MQYTKLKEYEKLLSDLFVKTAKEYWSDINFSNCDSYKKLDTILYNKGESIDEEFVEILFKKIKKTRDLGMIEYKYVTEDEYISGDESIWVKYIVLEYLGIQFYKAPFDEIKCIGGANMLMRILIYTKGAIELAKVVNKHIKSDNIFSSVLLDD